MRAISLLSLLVVLGLASACAPISRVITDNPAYHNALDRHESALEELDAAQEAYDVAAEAAQVTINREQSYIQEIEQFSLQLLITGLVGIAIVFVGIAVMLTVYWWFGRQQMAEEIEDIKKETLQKQATIHKARLEIARFQQLQRQPMVSSIPTQVNVPPPKKSAQSVTQDTIAKYSDGLTETQPASPPTLHRFGDHPDDFMTRPSVLPEI